MSSGRQSAESHQQMRWAVWMCPIVLIEAAIVSWLFLDQWAIHWLYEHPDSWHLPLWLNGFQHLGKACVPIWLLLFWSCISNRWRPTVVTWVALLLVCLTVCPLKLLAHRPRPQRPVSVSGQLEGQERHISLPVGLSFPSGDTASAFAIATVLSLFTGSGWGVAFFTAAGLVGLLRVTALHHYPSDVAAGAAIGVLCGCLAVQMMRQWPSLDRFHLPNWWRIVVGLLLVLVPLAGHALGMDSLLIFLRIYAVPLIASLLLWLPISVIRARRSRHRPRPSPATKPGAEIRAFL